MLIASIRDNLHEMSNLFSENTVDSRYLDLAYLE